MQADASPFFIGPHRFDAPDDEMGPLLDRRYELVPTLGEQVLWRHRVEVSGLLLGPTEIRRVWTLPGPVTVTVTDQRVVWVGEGSQLAVLAGGRAVGIARHRPPVRLPGLLSGQIRWQWPSRLELAPADQDGPARLLIVCDALRTIQQPALALGGPADEIARLARQVCRAVAAFRLGRPQLVDLSPQERDVLALRSAGRLIGESRITLPGSLPVEFRSRDDYYRRAADPAPDASGPAGDAAFGHR
ncbi:hypothetical protein [Micromonospora musae]|uniref:hypothetical protein n=1 Tax=Micromonospora musae TaxID=1894970 RepID=UPI002D784F22|nr:hypothetical protein [Micromonospora musae]